MAKNETPKKVNFDRHLFAKCEDLGGKDERFAPYLSHNRRFRGVVKYRKNNANNVPKTIKIRAKNVPRYDFREFWVFWEETKWFCEL